VPLLHLNTAEPSHGEAASETDNGELCVYVPEAGKAEHTDPEPHVNAVLPETVHDDLHVFTSLYLTPVSDQLASTAGASTATGADVVPAGHEYVTSTVCDCSIS